MQHYELLGIIPVKYDEKQIGSIKTKVLTLIKKQGGNVTKEEDLGRNKLAYKIKQERYGFYFLLNFDLESGNLNKAEKELDLMPEILRYLITRLRVKSSKELEREQKIQKRKIEEEEKKIKEEMVKEEKPKVPKKEKKISLEDLDKKLDEILKEDVVEE